MEGVDERVDRETNSLFVDTPEDRRRRLERDRRLAVAIAAGEDPLLAQLLSGNADDVARAEAAIDGGYSARVKDFLAQLAVLEATSEGAEVVGWAESLGDANRVNP
jgi:hypothetical protein